VDANEVERLLRSVIENIARRQQRPLELLQDITILRDRGYSDHDIAEKTGLSLSYAPVKAARQRPARDAHGQCNGLDQQKCAQHPVTKNSVP